MEEGKRERGRERFNGGAKAIKAERGREPGRG